LPLDEIGRNDVIDAETNRKVVRESWDAFNRGDMVAAAEEFWAEDTRNHGRAVGRAGVLAVLKDIQTTFPDVRFTPVEFVAEGEWVSVRGMFSGTHQGVGRLPVNGGMLVGVQPTGRHFEVQHIHMMQVRGGKIIDHYANRDDLGMLQQLGLLPASGSSTAL
jgi:predicted ester cyclase